MNFVETCLEFDAALHLWGHREDDIHVVALVDFVSLRRLSDAAISSLHDLLKFSTSQRVDQCQNELSRTFSPDIGQHLGKVQVLFEGGVNLVGVDEVVVEGRLGDVVDSVSQQRSLLPGEQLDDIIFVGVLG